MSDKQVKSRQDLNRAAIEALKGLHLHPARRLAELLESTAPLDLEVRVLLAAALRDANPYGVSAEIKGHEKSARRIDSLAKKRRDYRIGKIVERLVEELPSGIGPTKGFDVLASRRRPARDSSFYRKHYYEARRCDTWVSNARAQAGIFATLPDAVLRDIWHLADIDRRTPPTSDGYGKDRKGRLEVLEHELAKHGLAGRELEEALTEAFLMLEYFHPETL